MTITGAASPPECDWTAHWLPLLSAAAVETCQEGAVMTTTLSDIAKKKSEPLAEEVCRASSAGACPQPQDVLVALHVRHRSRPGARRGAVPGPVAADSAVAGDPEVRHVTTHVGGTAPPIARGRRWALR
jgi:hypothetical protein